MGEILLIISKLINQQIFKTSRNMQCVGREQWLEKETSLKHMYWKNKTLTLTVVSPYFDHFCIVECF